MVFGAVAAIVAFCALQITLNQSADREAAKVNARLLGTTAESVSVLVANNCEDRIAELLTQLVDSCPDIHAARVVNRYDEVVTVCGSDLHQFDTSDPSRGQQLHSFPVRDSGKRWGEIAFLVADPEAGFSLSRILADPFMLIVVCGTVTALFGILYLPGVLRHLIPSIVMPARVRAAFDSLSEGLVVLDSHSRILLVNRSFAATVGSDIYKIQGRVAEDLDWDLPPDVDRSLVFPWLKAIEHGTPQTGVILGLKTARNELRRFLVNATPMDNGNQEGRGALVSFNDVTALESKKVELSQMLRALEISRDEVKRQNQELQVLAMRDPLTGCLNRRAFFEHCEYLVKTSKRYGRQIGCLMIDVDHFKQVNDSLGHSHGDLILKGVAELLREKCRETDLICRIGGEEFCIVMPEQTLEKSMQAAERIRESIAMTKLAGSNITVSIGVTTNDEEVRHLEKLLDHADQALYVAKRTGRNRVISWYQLEEYGEAIGVAPARSHDIETLSEDGDEHNSIDEHTLAQPASGEENSIPFQAVSALLSALAYRDPVTAEHSCRVADLCVAVGDSLISGHELRLIETAALLHDIGKIGVPDSILLKPNELSEEEWKVMHRQDRIGVEIVRSAFASERLSEIIRTRHAHFGGQRSCPDLPVGEMIPLGARIISVCDAYDSMTTDRVYRPGMSQAEAFKELRKNAGSQFDPQVVERLVDLLSTLHSDEASKDSHKGHQTRLNLGRQVEELATAVESRDIDGLQALAQRLSDSASQYGDVGLAHAADRLLCELDETADIEGVLRLTHELIEQFKETQGHTLRG